MRNQQSYALILGSKRFSEIDKQLTLFIPNQGIKTVFANGALKQGSRFMGRCELFSLINCQLYYSPVKNTFTLKEIEVSDYFISLREQGLSYYAASVWTQLIVKSEALGEFKKIFNLTVQAFNLFNRKSVDESIILLQCFMRYAAFGGFFPDINGCAKCGCQIGQQRVFYLKEDEGVLICSECGSHYSTAYFSSKALDYVQNSLKLNLEHSLELYISQDDLFPLLLTFFSLIKEMTNLKLECFDFYMRSK